MRAGIQSLLPRVRVPITTATGLGIVSMSSTSSLTSPSATTTSVPKEDLQNQTLQLPDGRSLGFAEYGDPDGLPLLYFHGYPSSRLEAEPVATIARRQHLRILALDRPGFGLSTPQPHRSLLDWPVDVRAFAQAMGLSRFAIMGLSGGGPYAVACAHALPRDMLHSVGVFASGPPWAAGAHHMSLPRRITAWLSGHWPFGLKMILTPMVWAVRWLSRRNFVTKRLDAFIAAQDEKKEVREAFPLDNQHKTIAERREQMLNFLIGEPFRQGVDATVYEARLLSAQDWGFRFEDVEYSLIHIWHGTQDKNAPIQMIRYMADRLPGGVLTEVEDHTHYDMWKQIETAFAELKADSEKKKM